MRILMRILSFPFIAIIHFIFAMLVYFRSMYYLAIYGGESIIYDKTNNRKTIKETYKLVEEMMDVKSFKEEVKNYN